jgi:adenine deaminase
VAVGTSDQWLCAAVNRVIAASGGLSAVSEQGEELLPLPVAGLMSNEPYEKIAAAYSRIDHVAKEMGSSLRAPYMTLSFMALLVIPELKLSDRGLFDCAAGSLTSLFV